MVIVAPETTAPLGSKTVPRKEVVAVCAKTSGLQTRKKPTTKVTREPERMASSFTHEGVTFEYVAQAIRDEWETLGT
jgi:hypothetical protein